MVAFLHMQQETEGRQCGTIRILVIKPDICRIHANESDKSAFLNLPVRTEGAVTLGGGAHVWKPWG